MRAGSGGLEGLLHGYFWLRGKDGDRVPTFYSSQNPHWVGLAQTQVRLLKRQEMRCTATLACSC